MKLGCFIPQMGDAASGEAMVKVAEAAEKLGFNSVWVTDRLLFPVNPKTPYAASPDGKLPDAYRTVYDPLQALTWVAAHTSKVRLGTSVLDMPFYNPILLARQASALDQLSGGRLTLGMGQGWSEDEYQATNADATKRGRRANEFLKVLHEIWTTDPAEFDGKYFSLSKSHIAPKPLQKPHPPVFLAAFNPAALKRAAKYADGWHPVGLPFPAISQMWESVKTMAKEEGRDPATLKLIVRGNLNLTDAPAGNGRWPFTGNRDEVSQDIATARELGAEELIVDVTFSPNVKTADDFEKTNAMIYELANAVLTR
jgi:probable F420-dependent oxidoreductase